MTKKPSPDPAQASPSSPSSDGGLANVPDSNGAQVEIIQALDLCITREQLLKLLLEQAAAIYPCLNWLFGRIVDVENPVEVEILAYSPTRFRTVYLGMRIPILHSSFSHRLYEEKRLSYVGEDNETISLLNPQFVETFALTSFMGVPMLFEARIIGLLYAATFKGEKAAVPSESQQVALHNLAQAGALAYQRIQTQTDR